jgi:CRISPR system Cascade subunit CasC
MKTKLIEISMLKNFPPSNLNRDEGGNPKDCVFGGVLRGRISSQCLKRNIRKSALFAEDLDEELLGVRTVHLPSFINTLLLEKGHSQEISNIVTSWLAETGQSKTKKKQENKEENLEGHDEENIDKNQPQQQETTHLKTKQIMFFSKTELLKIADLLSSWIEKENIVLADLNKKKKMEDLEKGFKNELSKLKLKPNSIDISMFGRMITSNEYKNVEASVQVAHAISTNKLEREFDYFTAVDDYPVGDDLNQAGAGMIGDTAFNSNCYYLYAAIDLEELTTNLSELGESAREIAKKSLLSFIKSFAYVNPSGKQNSFAAHAMPSMVCVTVKDKKIPVNLADAFVKPASSSYQKDLNEVSIEKLCDHIDVLDEKFSDIKPIKRFWFSIRDDFQKPTFKENCSTFNDLINNLEEIL